MTQIKKLTLALGTGLVCQILAGCGMSTSTATHDVSIGPAQHRLTGQVRGGQQPVSSALIQLWAVGNTGAASASTQLVQSSVYTDNTGGFDITGQWNCSDTATYGSDPLLYITATGGNPGLGPGGSNPALGMLVALGPCSTVTANTRISINELTTVASVYSLAPFMTDAAHVGAAASKMSGLKSAFETVHSLVDTSSGFAPGPGIVSGETVPLPLLYTLADIAAACVNTNGTGTCDTLFSATTPSGGTTPSNTIGALLSLAHTPSQNVPALFGLVLPSAPFQPSLATAPQDLAVSVKFTGGGLNGPTGIAIDASGNIWVANRSGSSITELSNQGASLAGSSGYSAGGTIVGAQDVAIDTTGNVWVADTLLSKIFKLNVSGGIVQSSSAFANVSLGPTSIAVDKQNHIWTANFAGGNVTELNSDGTIIGSGPFTGGASLLAPTAIAVDAQGSVWVTDHQASVVLKFDKNQALLSGAGFADAAMAAPLGLALDASGRAWVADSGYAGVSLLGSDGTSVHAQPLTSPTLNAPAAIALDGVGTAWVVNGTDNGSLTAIPSAASATSTSVGALATPLDVAVDGSGNVWTANSGDNSLTKFIGLASPVVTPLSASTGP
ncbi:MAG: NHL repeat-containing protein [Acidobacteriota bacterium]